MFQAASPAPRDTGFPAQQGGGKTQAAVNKTGKVEAAERDRKTQATFRLVFTHTLFMKLSFLSLSLKDKRVNQRCQKTHNLAAKQRGHTLHPPITAFTSQHTPFRKSSVEIEPQATPIHPLTSYTSFRKSSPHPLASDSHPPTYLIHFHQEIQCGE